MKNNTYVYGYSYCNQWEKFRVVEHYYCIITINAVLSLGDRIKRCTRRSVPCLQFSRSRKAAGTSNLAEKWCLTTTRVTKWVNLSLKSKVNVTETKVWKSFLCLRQKWIDLRQIKTKMITDPFYTYRAIHFTSGNASCFCDISVIRVITRVSRVSQRPPRLGVYELLAYILLLLPRVDRDCRRQRMRNPPVSTFLVWWPRHSVDWRSYVQFARRCVGTPAPLRSVHSVHATWIL